MVNASAPLRVGVLIFPAFTALDVFGPIQVLNSVSFKEPMELSMISADMNPVPVDRNIVGDQSYGRTGEGPSPFFAEWLMPTHTLDDPPEVDVLIVPGGGGTRNLTVTQPYVDYLAERLAGSECEWPQYVLSVCTGAALLSRSGRIGGRNATTNKAAFNWVKTQENAQDVNWIAKARWVVDGKLWTSSGVSAGTDMALAWVEQAYSKNASKTAEINLEWNKLEQEDDPFAEVWGLV